MPSFILRNLDPVFWGRVQAKADAEGTSVYNLIVHLLKQWLAALLLLSTVACGYKNPLEPTAPVVQPTAGVATRIELSANPGIGSEAGSGRISARVYDGLAHTLAGVTVTFTAAGGTLSASQVTTDDTGNASTTITGPAGPIAISAIVGTVEQKTQIAIQAIPPAPPVSIPPVLQPPVSSPPPTTGPTTPAPPALTAILSSRSPSGTRIVKGGTLIFSVTVANLNGESIAAFQWDLDGDEDGDFEFTTAASQQESDPYPTAGLFTARVKVTTDTGRTTIATLPFVVTSS